MSKTRLASLNPTSILAVPLQAYGDDFTFIVNGNEFKTSCLISDLLSPIICQHHTSDPTFDTFVINTKKRGDFSHILNLVNFEPTYIPLNEISFFSEVMKILGNKSIDYPEDTTNITVDNVLTFLDIHQNDENFNLQHFSKEIDFASSHFFEICETQEEEMKNLSISTLFQILSNDHLRLKSEDQLLNFINKLYSNNSKYSILYETVLFSNISSEMMKTYIAQFDPNDMTGGIWKKLSKRLCQKIELSLEEADDEISEEILKNRYDELSKAAVGVLYEYNDDKIFNGIFNHFQEETASQIESKVNFTSSSVYSSKFQPSNVALFGNKSKYFYSDDIKSSWICFDFKDHRVIPTHYTIRSPNWDTNSSHPKSWVIEASNDNKSWKIIDKQENCSILNQARAVHTFELNQPKSKEFKFIRMRSIGPDWWGHNYLALESFEIYGRLI